jgi:16S rRNA (adenine1518-N6/adenine1519-N6)-dimethyltransferase
MEKIHAKKSLGQNFLQDDTLIERIIEMADLPKSATVLEIGPGLGALTLPLLTQIKKVIAVEADKRFVTIFTEKKIENLSLYEGNILDINIEKILESELSQDEEYHVLANIPYYITAPIIRLLLSLPRQPKQIILMVQDEVAERLTAKAGAMSLLSIMAQYYADTEKLFFVPRESFDPVPKVDSAVIRLLPKKIFDKEVDQRFFRVVKVGFQARRKTLVNNLNGAFHLKKEDVENLLEELQLSTDIRAQALTLENWEALSEKILHIESERKSQE